ncbi:MAG: hypothetical protein UW35_C0005G0029 [Candidatus Collierbacteria bacterium GW2011_GWF2_44_15]|uniref:BRCT domain-containing protein n=3 Tax=Candidatus Collieribacteriota TaxID=1752725 RepID=A0A0G1JSS5_9BACT|nr:MAG: hypothetical protein UW26_C0039G0006 [Candidatus Collierbacteria bacterium GW2011_GWF1_44_12]KKT46952.1 MAG: hypothetical protein UW35_C0005G0029 [Candidatus Collierbacteria bacterium GW2011_GWF2_44_15]KKU28527.1 MAG: hypothetical protein UX41_C0033G0009 [Candidatus Collierbacteria bacterium GW2011_GWE1_46_18]
MSEIEDSLDKFGGVVEDVLMTSLAEADAQIRLIDENSTEAGIIEILKSANSLVRLVCGNDDVLYEEWRYRLIKAEKGKYIIVQGQEIDVETGDDTSISED